MIPSCRSLSAAALLVLVQATAALAGDSFVNLPWPSATAQEGPVCGPRVLTGPLRRPPPRETGVVATWESESTPPFGGNHGPLGLSCTPDSAAVPTPEEAQRVVHALDELTRAFCRGDERGFTRRLSRRYDHCPGDLLDAMRRAHRTYEGFALSYRVESMRSFGRTVDVVLGWSLRYNEKERGVGVVERGTTHLGLDRRDGLRLLGQKGTCLFGTF